MGGLWERGAELLEEELVKLPRGDAVALEVAEAGLDARPRRIHAARALGR